MKSRKTLLALAASTALAGVLLATSAVSASQLLETAAQQQVAPSPSITMAEEGKCGEGKCGGDKGDKEGKCGEGKCGGDKGDKEGKCGEGKCGGDKDKDKDKEGKCGEGKCGGSS